MNSNKPLPWMQHFPNDFAGVTRGWPLSARAVLRELLDAQWIQGPLPEESQRLRAIVRCTPNEWRTAWPYVEPHFPIWDDGKRRNAELDDLWKRQLDRYQRQVEGGRKRWQNVTVIRGSDDR